MQICPEALFTLGRLEEHGYTAYLVGGCVRDFIMDKVPYDFDITTNATPDKIEECFSDIRTLDVGKKHGTITLVFESMNIEVTTYRIDGEYKDSRHPESVTFTDRIEDDLARRDFTINAIAYSPKRGFVDPFGGREDIEKRIIRCVGEPSKRFDEDALRIMRGIRFSARFGFEIEENTLCAMKEKRNLLLNISKERIHSELSRTLCEKFFFMPVFRTIDVFYTIMPFMKHVDFAALEKTSANNSLYVRLGILLYCLAGDKRLKEKLHGLKFDNATINRFCDTMLYLPECVGKCTDFDVKKAVSEIGYLSACDLYEILYCKTSESVYSDALIRLREFHEASVCMSIKQLSVKGNEIIEKYSIHPSQTGKILSCLLDEVMKDEIPNEKAALLDAAEKYISMS